MTSFWNDPNLEPKRSFSYLLSIPGPSGRGIENYLIKKVKKPGFEISESEHKFLNHSFYFPGKIKWKEIPFTIVDVVNPNQSQTFLQLLKQSGYNNPQGPADTHAQVISKQKAVAALGIPKIRQLDANGLIVEEWALNNAWVKSAEFGDLDNDTEELMHIEVVMRYDFPTFTTGPGSGPGSATLFSNAQR